MTSAVRAYAAHSPKGRLGLFTPGTHEVAA
jgi:hypothetical protein